MRTEYYVWYRVTGDAHAAVAAVTRVLADVAAGTGIVGRLLHRRNEPAVWMEVYDGVTDATAFEHALIAAGDRYGIVQFAADGMRHVEAFVAQDR
jgi:hypothetical protein